MIVYYHYSCILSTVFTTFSCFFTTSVILYNQKGG
nr:MAG TPA: hypothetical protein [Caudoviricetes sp.]